MRKRIANLLLILCLGIILAGNGLAQPDPALTEAEVLAHTETVYMHLVDQEFGAVLDMLDDSVRSMLSEDALAAGYASEIGPIGAFVSIVEVLAIPDGEAFSTILTAEHAQGQAQLICGFSPNGKISALRIANLSAADVPDPLPLSLPAGCEERAVTLHSGTEKELTGALVLPNGFDGNTPVVVMAHGSGISDLDETIGPNKPFRDIAYGLAAHGIASLRYDKLHYAHPELATASITIDDEYTGTVLEALRIARTEEALGPAYLLGHSQGGMLTPYLMKQSEGGFAGGIILAGTPRQLWALSFDQSVAMLEGAPEEQANLVLAQLHAEREKLDTLEDLSEDVLLETRVFGMMGPYLLHMSQIDPIALAHDNNAPLLILQGEEDFQVSYAVDYAMWQEGLEDMGALVAYKSYPGLSHLFMAARGSIHDPMDAYSVPDLVDDVVIDDIADWIHNQATK